MSLNALSDAGRAPELPFTMTLAAEELRVEAWLRTLPGRRYVGRARYKQRWVLVKVFVGPRAKQKLEAELLGARLLSEGGLPTPALLDSGVSNDGAWMVAEWLEGAQTLSQVAHISVEGMSLDAQDCPAALAEVAELVCGMHEAGVVQDDIHPANFLYSAQRWWIVDAADVRCAKDPATIFQNLGVFLAQLPESWQGSILRSYGVDLSSDEARECLEKSRQWRAWRANDLSTKSLRDCSLFRVEQSCRRFTSCWREETLELHNLDEQLSRGKVLKDGGSSSVGLIECGGRHLVLKRYNLKGWLHWLKRFWRPTRAWHSWKVGHRLRVLGIDTPKPIAMMEERCGPFRGRGYLLSELAPGQDLVKTCQDEVSTRRVAEQIRDMLNIFIREKISHGDFKGTNLLWDGRLRLIDLDAVQWHSSSHRWRIAFEKDVQRLLRNWPEGSLQHRVMSEVIIDSIKY